MTLIGVKPSTKDVDFIAPEVREHDYLAKQLKAPGYKRATGSDGYEMERVSSSTFFVATAFTRRNCWIPLLRRGGTPS